MTINISNILGHSRTVVGVEESRDGSLKLLIFDPSTPRSRMQQLTRAGLTGQSIQVRVICYNIRLYKCG